MKKYHLYEGDDILNVFIFNNVAKGEFANGGD